MVTVAFMGITSNVTSGAKSKHYPQPNPKPISNPIMRERTSSVAESILVLDIYEIKGSGGEYLYRDPIVTLS